MQQTQWQGRHAVAWVMGKGERRECGKWMAKPTCRVMQLHTRPSKSACSKWMARRRGREKGWRGRHAVAWSCLAKKKHWRGRESERERERERERKNGEAEMRSDETLARPTCGLMSHWPRGSCKKQAETLYLASVRKFETARNWWNSGCRNKKLFETIVCCSETNVGRRKLNKVYSIFLDAKQTWHVGGKSLCSKEKETETKVLSRSLFSGWKQTLYLLVSNKRFTPN